jgi:short subunit dehydrogenase-like uncharacterized protein
MLLIYGANGYTGRLIVERALARGLKPVLSGRNAQAIGEMAAAHGLEARPAALDDPRRLDGALQGITTVLHCAGPFSATARAMADACLRARAHYLDITGEISVFEMMAARSGEAGRSGVMLLPGAGFDVVPSDCLAAHLKRRLPSATSLVLAFTGGVGLSRGTATTMIENVGRGGAIRRDGRITLVPAAWRERDIDFGDKVRHSVTIPWGDVSTAFHSTGIPNIEVYVAATRGSVRAMRLSQRLGWLLASAPAQALLKWRIRSGAPGPSAQQRRGARARLWGEASNAAGEVVRARLVAPDGYTLTALTAVAAAERCLAGKAVPGFQTPSRAFGADFILEFDDVTREDLPSAPAGRA